MRVLLTGAFGNVGLSTLEELIKRGHEVRVFDIKSGRNLKLSRRYEGRIEIIWGDLRNQEEVEKAVGGQEVVIHTAAIIPPLADQNPQLAEAVNVGGTLNVIRAMERQPGKPKLIYTSSIAIYGDRRKSPLIKPIDSPNPNPGDEYAKQKLKCENLIRESKLEWVIFRLTYIVSPDKLQMDPLMFRMPLDTCLEICHTKDVGLALANAVENDQIWGRVMHIAGGERCRITYKEYIERMMEIFGLGKGFLPPGAFSEADFHCGFMTTEESQRLLHYQRHTLDDYFEEVKQRVRFKRCFMRAFRPFIRIWLLRQSPYYHARHRREALC